NGQRWGFRVRRGLGEFITSPAVLNPGPKGPAWPAVKLSLIRKGCDGTAVRNDLRRVAGVHRGAARLLRRIGADRSRWACEPFSQRDERVPRPRPQPRGVP